MKVTDKFFDFYSLSLLRYFAGPETLNYSNKARRVQDQYERIVDEFYLSVRHALEYSVFREFRHFTYYTECAGDNLNNRLKELSDNVSSIFFIEYTPDAFVKRVKSKLELDMRSSLIDIKSSFDDYLWDCDYGGKLWGKAAAFLIENPRTHKAKELWVDRVLDLQHNTGHILNKTEFFQLSLRNQFANPSGGRGRRTALNYRRYAKTISELAHYSSPSVKKLVKANLNQFPKAIQ